MTNNILTASITIKGTRPLLWHHFGPDAMPLEKQERTGVAGNDPEEWRKTVLMTKDRQLYLPSTYAFATLRDGSKNTKKGRGSIQPMVVSTLQIVDNLILIDRFVPAEPIPTDPMEPVYMDIQGVRNPATKGRNVRYRVAASAGWVATFKVEWDKTIVARAQMEAVAIDAGRLSGIGDGRNVGFGRFAVQDFTVAD